MVELVALMMRGALQSQGARCLVVVLWTQGDAMR